MAQPGRLTCCTPLLAAHRFRSATPLPSVFSLPRGVPLPLHRHASPLPPSRSSSFSVAPTTSSGATDLACPTSACKSCTVCISHDLLAAHARQRRRLEKRNCDKEVGARSAAVGARCSICIVPEGALSSVP
jgi:hypothetical protein